MWQVNSVILFSRFRATCCSHHEPGDAGWVTAGMWHDCARRRVAEQLPVSCSPKWNVEDVSITTKHDPATNNRRAAVISSPAPMATVRPYFQCLSFIIEDLLANIMAIDISSIRLYTAKLIWLMRKEADLILYIKQTLLRAQGRCADIFAFYSMERVAMKVHL